MGHVATVTVKYTEVPADATDFPLYIDLADLPSSFWDVVANGGGDIRVFAADGTTEWPREVVSCNTSTKKGELHTLVPSLSSSVDTVVQIHADGVSSDYAVGATYGAQAVWADYAVVMHLDDLSDSTGNATIDTVFPAADPTPVSAGKIGGAHSFDGTQSRVYAELASDVTTYVFTMQCWFNADSFSGDHTYVSVGDKDVATTQYRIQNQQNTSNIRTYARGTSVATGPGLSATLGTNHMAHAVSSASNSRRVYLDGVAGALDTGSVSTVTPLDRFAVGTSADSSPFGFADATIDEARLRFSELSPDWIATEHANQNSPSTFYIATAAGGSTTVEASDVSQAQTIDAIALTQSNILAIQGVSQGQVIDNVVLTGSASLSVDEVAQGQAVEVVTLAQSNALSSQSVTQGQTIDNAVLTQAHVLLPQGVTQGQTVDAAALAVISSLSVQSVAQGQTLDEALTTVAGVLSVSGVTQAQTLDSLELIQANILAPNGITQEQSLENATVGAASLAVTPDGLSQGQVVDSTALTQYHVLAVDGLTQAQAIDVALFGGLVIGELNGEVVVFAALGGNVYAIPALSGTIH